MNRILLISTLVIGVLSLAACGGGQPAAPQAAAEIPVTLSANGDAANGKLIFEGEGGCAACHSTGTDQLVGPGLAGVLSPAGVKHPSNVNYNGKLPNGKERTEENYADWIRNGGQGQIGMMSPHDLTDQQIADLLAYLRTLK